MITDKLVAHRGWPRRYPENSLLGIERALAAGALHVEIDIQLTANHKPYLCHDDNLQRICGSPLNINRIDSTQLATLSAYEPERLGEQFKGTPVSPLTDCIELFKRHPQATLYVELKRQSIRHFGVDNVLNSVLPLVRQIEQQARLISFDIPILQRAVDNEWDQVIPILSSWQQAYGTEISKLSPALIFSDINHLRPESAPAHRPTELPYPVAFYEVDDYEKACSLLRDGAELVETFAVGELIQRDREQENSAGDGSARDMPEQISKPHAE